MVGNEFFDFTVKFLTVERCRIILREFAGTVLITKLSKITFF